MSDRIAHENGLRPTLSGVSNVSSARARLGLAELVRSLSAQDAATRYNEEEANNRTSTDGSPDSDSTRGSGRRTVISWRPDDEENPYNWSKWKKIAILITTMSTVINSTMGSALPSMAIPSMTAQWGVTSKLQKVLPISCFLIGYSFGPIFWGPLSEHLGRRLLTLITFIMFMIWTMACALAPNWPAFLVFRFFTGVNASAPIAIVTGIFADIFHDPQTRGRAMAWFMATTVFGPLMAPIISGFCSTSIGWRWTFWVGLIYAGVTLIPLLFLPETYGPVLLTRRARKMRKADPKAEVYAAAELEPHDLKDLVTRVLTRPIRMLFTELIVTTTCLYLSLVYSIFYMSFQAFPIIFQDVYGLSPGVTGLCYLPIGAGALAALPIFFGYDRFLCNARARNATWANQEEFRRLPLATLGGPLFVISLFWLGWTSRPDIPLVVPLLGGIPFGMGFQLIFMALLNYITDAYEIFAASANAAASSARSTCAVVLPLATTPMFLSLGINGACSVLAGLSLLMCLIPFIFIWKGERIRAGSKFCIALKEKKLEMEKKKNKEQKRKQARSKAHGHEEKGEIV
ncbi:major facilitator superfamily transporter [Xylariomycetidae sp. FL2044]|nr:major facilitator superfamily transporter [Xylariomycetidae sp. FL2044]